MNYCMHSRDLWALRINTGMLKTKDGFYKSVRSSIPKLSKGIPDVFIFIRGAGKAVLVECKADISEMRPDKSNKLKSYKRKGKQSPEQIYCEDFCKEFGLPYVLAYTLEDVTKAIEGVRV